MKKIKQKFRVNSIENKIDDIGFDTPAKVTNVGLKAIPKKGRECNIGNGSHPRWGESDITLSCINDLFEDRFRLGQVLIISVKPDDDQTEIL